MVASLLKSPLTLAWLEVRTKPPYPRLRMYFRFFILAAVTPLADALISSKAIEGMYFISV